MLATENATARACESAKTRVRASTSDATSCSSGATSRSPQWLYGNSRPEPRSTSAISFFENWNRFYDPGTGRYSASDPVLVGAGLADLLSNRPYAYAGNSPLGSYDADGRKISTEGLTAEQAERVWRYTVAASRDQIIGAKVKSLIADSRTIQILIDRTVTGAFTVPQTESANGGAVTGADVVLGTPGNSPEGYGNSDYTNLIHELGHTYDFFQPGVELAPDNTIVGGSTDAANDREAVLWENRARLAKPHASPTVFEQGKPQCTRADICRSRLRRVHWNQDGSYRLVFP